MQDSNNNKMVRTKVWDLPIRLFHWSMLGLLVALWWTADAGEMDWHQVAAYSLMVLILFRVVWGFIGSDTARFSHFIKSPKVAINYVKTIKKQRHDVGHNPLGGYMVLAMILVLLVQLISGLFATDEVFTEGPLFSTVSEASAQLLTWLHKVNFNLLLVMIGMHVLAVIVHQLRGDKLVGAMVTGYKFLPQEAESLTFSSSIKALTILSVFACTIGYWLIYPVIQML